VSFPGRMLIRFIFLACLDPHVRIIRSQIFEDASSPPKRKGRSRSWSEIGGGNPFIEDSHILIILEN
jgi:hypothetical protein